MNEETYLKEAHEESQFYTPIDGKRWFHGGLRRDRLMIVSSVKLP